MKKKAKQKRGVKSDSQDDSSLSGQGSEQIKVTKKASKAVVKEEIPAEDSVAAEERTTSKKNREHNQSARKRKRSTSVSDSTVAQRQDDSEVVHDAPPSRKRKTAAVSLQNSEPLEQEKPVSQSVAKRRPPTRTRKLTVASVQRKKADKEQLESAVVSDVKKSTKVKRELSPPASATKAVNKTSAKTEKKDVVCTSLPQDSCKKYIGAHVSIAGMSVYYLFHSCR